MQKRNPVDIAHTLKAPVLGLYGGQDAGIPLDDVHQMQDALAGGNEMAKASQIIVYPESNHAFYADYRPSYNEPDAKDAWTWALDWFKRYLA